MKVKKIKAGFLLTEVLITIVIIAIAMLAVTPVLFMGVKSGKIAKNKSFETNIAQKEIESFKQRDFVAVNKEIKDLMDPISATPRETTFEDCFKGGNTAHADCNTTNILHYKQAIINQYVKPDTLEVKETSVVGFFPLVITREYRFLNDTQDQLGEAIQLSVTVQIQEPNSKPVTLTSLIGRDKIQN